MKQLMEQLWAFPKVPSHHVLSEVTAASWGLCVHRIRPMPQGPGPALVHSQLTLQTGSRGHLEAKRLRREYGEGKPSPPSP